MSSEIEKAYEYCRSVTKTHAKSFYFAAKFLPKHKRLPIYALYALCRHVDDEVDESGVENEREAAAAVENWRAKLDEIYFNAKTPRIYRKRFKRKIKLLNLFYSAFCFSAFQFTLPS